MVEPQNFRIRKQVWAKTYNAIRLKPLMATKKERFRNYAFLVLSDGDLELTSADLADRVRQLAGRSCDVANQAVAGYLGADPRFRRIPNQGGRSLFAINKEYSEEE